LVAEVKYYVIICKKVQAKRIDELHSVGYNVPGIILANGK